KFIYFTHFYHFENSSIINRFNSGVNQLFEGKFTRGCIDFDMPPKTLLEVVKKLIFPNKLADNQPPNILLQNDFFSWILFCCFSFISVIVFLSLLFPFYLLSIPLEPLYVFLIYLATIRLKLSGTESANGDHKNEPLCIKLLRT